MKYLKLFEELEVEPKIGNYVICKLNSKAYGPEFKKFLPTIIGKIVNRQDVFPDKVNYAIRYEEDDVPEEFRDYFISHLKSFNYVRWQNSKDIIFWSENKEDVEAYLEAKKYNM